MIKKLLSTAAVAALFFGSASAQQLSNGGFETWSTSGNTSGKANDWAGYGDMAVAQQFPFSMAATYFKETTIKNSGTASMKLETSYLAAFQDTIVGFAVSGAWTAGFQGFDGLAYTEKPTSFSMSVNYQPNAGSDTAAVIVYFFKTNATTGLRDTIGYTADYIFATSGWEVKNLPVQWASYDNPESVLVLLTSSINDAAGNSGSKLYADDVMFGDFVTGKSEPLSSGIATRIAPNPATNVLNLTTSDKNIGGVIKMFDVTGKEVKVASISAVMNNISIAELNNGVYFYQVIDANNKVAATGKFSVVK